MAEPSEVAAPSLLPPPAPSPPFEETAKETARELARELEGERELRAARRAEELASLREREGLRQQARDLADRAGYLELEAGRLLDRLGTWSHTMTPETKETLRQEVKERLDSARSYRVLISKYEEKVLEEKTQSQRRSPVPGSTWKRWTSSRNGGLSGCEDGHEVSSVSDDGQIVVLEDDSVWEVESLDQIDSSLWLPGETVVACEDKLVNVDSRDVVEARRLRIRLWDRAESK